MPASDPPSRRGYKRARTRAALIDAASALVREQGFERTSLEAVAALAGMTRGAIYGNFRNREDLFLAVAATHWQPIMPPPQEGATFFEHMQALAEAVIAALPARRAAAIGAASFQLFALTHPAMQARIAAANGEIYRRTADAIRAAVPEHELGMPAEHFVRVTHALIDGLLFLHALTPDLIGPETIRAAFSAVGRGVAGDKKEAVLF